MRWKGREVQEEQRKREQEQVGMSEQEIERTTRQEGIKSGIAEEGKW